MNVHKNIRARAKYRDQSYKNIPSFHQDIFLNVLEQGIQL